MSPRFTLFNPRPATWDAEADARAILSTAIDEHNPSSVWALFSGGHDSLCSTHIAAQHPRFSGVVTIFTGIGLRATRRFVYETCKLHGWPLRVYRPRASDRYHQLVVEHGFPGPAQHSRMYRRLKERSLRRHIAAVKQHDKDRIVLVSGIREAESRVRMGRTEPAHRDGASVWVAPCISWENSDKHAYMERHALARNSVVDLLCMSGECLCGAFARGQAELNEIGIWFPDEAAEIEALQERARLAGVPCRWGERPEEPTECDPPTQGKLWLCYSCEIKRGAA